MAILTHHQDFTRRLLYQLRWIVNEAKSELISFYRLQFIGSLFQMNLDLHSIPRDRWIKIPHHLYPTLQQPNGKCFWDCLLQAQDLTIRSRLQLRPIQEFLAPHIRQQDPSVSIALPAHLRTLQLMDGRYTFAGLGCTSRGSGNIRAEVVRSVHLAHEQSRVGVLVITYWQEHPKMPN